MTFDPSKDILRTNSGDPIPQVWDETQQKFIPYEGKVQLSGSNVEVVWQSAVEIRNTTLVSLPEITVDECGEFYILIENTLNQSVTTSIEKINGHGWYGYSTIDSNGDELKITVGTSPSKQLVAWHPKGLAYNITMTGFIICDVAPTSGSIAVYIVKKGF